MYQRRGLERLARLLMVQLCRGQLSQLVIVQRQELLRRRWIAGIDLRQNSGHVDHGQSG